MYVYIYFQSVKKNSLQRNTKTTIKKLKTGYNTTMGWANGLRKATNVGLTTLQNHFCALSNIFKKQ